MLNVFIQISFEYVNPLEIIITFKNIFVVDVVECAKAGSTIY